MPFPCYRRRGSSVSRRPRLPGPGGGALPGARANTKIGAGPANRLSLVDELGPPAAVEATVVDGTGVFRESWCPRRRC